MPGATGFATIVVTSSRRERTRSTPSSTSGRLLGLSARRPSCRAPRRPRRTRPIAEDLPCIPAPSVRCDDGGTRPAPHRRARRLRQPDALHGHGRRASRSPPAPRSRSKATSTTAVTALDGTGQRTFNVHQSVPHNGVWPRRRTSARTTTPGPTTRRSRLRSPTGTASPGSRSAASTSTSARAVRRRSAPTPDRRWTRRTRSTRRRPDGPGRARRRRTRRTRSTRRTRRSRSTRRTRPDPAIPLGPTDPTGPVIPTDPTDPAVPTDPTEPTDPPATVDPGEPTAHGPAGRARGAGLGVLAADVTFQSEVLAGRPESTGGSAGPPVVPDSSPRGRRRRPGDGRPPGRRRTAELSTTGHMTPVPRLVAAPASV